VTSANEIHQQDQQRIAAKNHRDNKYFDM